jgi:copper chaperone CopZ
MKTLALLFQIVLLVSLIACNSSNTKPTNQPGEILSEITAEIGVEGMTCTGCENSINKSVEKLEGIVEVTSSHIDKKTVVKFDESKISIEQIKEAITQVGYKIIEEQTQN